MVRPHRPEPQTVIRVDFHWDAILLYRLAQCFRRGLGAILKKERAMERRALVSVVNDFYSVDIFV